VKEGEDRKLGSCEKQRTPSSSRTSQLILEEKIWEEFLKVGVNIRDL